MPKKTPKKSTTKKTKKKPARRNENKTVATSAPVSGFLKNCPEKYQDDAHTLIDIMSSITKEPPKMWGPSIVGFGSYHYKYDSGREGDFMLVGFSPRKTNLSLYLLCGLDENPDLLESLGTYKTGKSCLYIKSLDDIHLPTLKKLIRASIKSTRAKYPD